MSKIAIARTNEITREDWLQLRKRGIGGSDAAVACGLSRWKSRLMLYLEKTRAEVDETNTECMYWGTVMEPVLRQEFAKRTGFKVQEIPFMFAYREYPWMLANIDGLVTEPDGTKALLEIKTANGFKAKEWEDGLPQEYYIQIQHYLAVCDLPKAWVAVLIGVNDFRYFPIGRDEETIQLIIALEAEFWSYVEKQAQPPVDEKSGDGLAMLYPKSDSKTTIILPEEADNLIAVHMEIMNVLDQLKPELEKCENQLKAMMKTAACAKTPQGYTVKWQTTTSTRIDTTRLKREKPEIAAEFSVTSSSRRFSITEPKAESEATSKAS